ncbi:hypothetical protein LDC_0436, partial [sediment metagenome]
ALLQGLAAAGVPLVMADGWFEDMPHDAVAQDGFAGGLQAGAWLAGRGHRRIAFVGPSLVGADLQVVERRCGAAGALGRAGLELPGDLLVSVPLHDPRAAVGPVTELLSRADRPTAVLALWQGLGPVVARAARDLGLAPGATWTWSAGRSRRSTPPTSSAASRRAGSAGRNLELRPAGRSLHQPAAPAPRQPAGGAGAHPDTG